MKKSTTHQGRPTMRFGGWPMWWHHHGRKMSVHELDLQRLTLALTGGAKLWISYNHENKKEQEWLVDWEVVQHTYMDELVRGRRVFSSDELACAFGLRDWVGDYGDWLLKEYGATTAEQMLFIRYERFLNIPCPGTGHDGDPNISIWLDDTITESVGALILKASMTRS